MKKYLFILLISFAIASCGGEEVELPIPEDKLVKMLADIHLAEAAMQNLTGVTKDSIAELYYNQISERHGVERVDFDTTMHRIKKDAILMSKLYTKVIEELSTQEAKVK